MDPFAQSTSRSLLDLLAAGLVLLHLALVAGLVLVGALLPLGLLRLRQRIPLFTGSFQDQPKIRK